MLQADLNHCCWVAWTSTGEKSPSDKGQIQAKVRNIQHHKGSLSWDLKWEEKLQEWLLPKRSSGAKDALPASETRWPESHRIPSRSTQDTQMQQRGDKKNKSPWGEVDGQKESYSKVILAGWSNWIVLREVSVLQQTSVWPPHFPWYSQVHRWRWGLPGMTPCSSYSHQ